ncbi:hypothetical protein MRB53_007330 [Persea americana]|uniref:Uncharacterized protein n=1 Tax=Persea americana TaxID=3435 RepID=A0ACC2MIL6_PERAE|nr:hypothetical protein MRB53_007330 [Persea americana]
MLASILASVASSSIIDLVDAKLVCKEFSEAGSDYLVLKRVTLETIPSTSWTEHSPQKSYFLKQCEEAENPDAIYNLGMYNYFSYREFQLGRQLLEKSADSGHPHSIYALGMILLSEKESQLEAIKLLKKIDNVETTKCKQFSEAALDYLVFKRVTLETIPSTSWTERSPQKSYFLKHCEEAKNPDALYNLGMGLRTRLQSFEELSRLRSSPFYLCSWDDTC